MKSLFSFIRYSFVLALITQLTGPVALAQEAGRGWSNQGPIPLYELFTEDPPFLVADQNHVVHAFNAQLLDLDDEMGERAIVYRQWSVDSGWTEPRDILISSTQGQLALLGVYLDPENVVHLLVQMNHSELYYTSAWLPNAGDARAWSMPEYVGGQAVVSTAGITNPAAISGDGQGVLMIIYSGSRDGNGIYAALSADDGNTWSEPEPIFFAFNASQLPVSTALDMGQSGYLHAVWSTFNQDGSGGPGFYARFDVEQRRWSQPMQLDVPGIRTPNVVEYKGTLIVTYYHHNVNQNWWRWSQDLGVTWSDPILLSPYHRGTNRAVSFVVDSNNTLHLLFGQRIDDNNHGMWHTVWVGGGWGPILPVVRGPQLRDVRGGGGFDPTAARAVISNGNLLLVTWGTDGAAGVNGAWYAYTQLDTPELPAIPLSIATATPAPTLTPLPVLETPPTVEPTPVSVNPTAEVQRSARSGETDPAMVLIVGLMPVTVLVSLLVVAKMWRQR